MAATSKKNLAQNQVETSSKEVQTGGGELVPDRLEFLELMHLNDQARIAQMAVEVIQRDFAQSRRLAEEAQKAYEAARQAFWVKYAIAPGETLTPDGKIVRKPKA